MKSEGEGGGECGGGNVDFGRLMHWMTPRNRAACPRYRFPVIDNQDAPPIFTDRKRFHETSAWENGTLMGAVQRVHDLRLVRPLEELRRSPLNDRGACQLGNRVLRVSDSVAGQPDR